MWTTTRPRCGQKNRQTFCQIFIFTMCVQWAACCVWGQRWSGMRGRVCWIPREEVERSQWWIARDEPTPPGWSWTPRPRTTSSPVATENKHVETSWTLACFSAGRKQNSYDLLSLWSATSLQQSQRGPWNLAHLYHRCHTSRAEEIRWKSLEFPRWL